MDVGRQHAPGASTSALPSNSTPATCSTSCRPRPCDAYWRRRRAGGALHARLQRGRKCAGRGRGEVGGGEGEGGGERRNGTGLGELNVHALLQFLSDADDGGKGVGESGGDPGRGRPPRGGEGSGGGERQPGQEAVVSLLQNSFSRRGWFAPRQDTYKGNGRVRHEWLILNVGPLLSVHVDSYQSHEVGQPDDATRRRGARCGADARAPVAGRASGPRWGLARRCRWRRRRRHGRGPCVAVRSGARGPL